mmetsp:Transcript_68367/g.193762  ORF Transcript_68367/g.193762 Transcript_68367/m.193762 type:complete len:145 (-) Transcript_68367:37-471(-)
MEGRENPVVRARFWADRINQENRTTHIFKEFAMNRGQIEKVVVTDKITIPRPSGNTGLSLAGNLALGTPRGEQDPFNSLSARRPGPEPTPGSLDALSSVQAAEKSITARWGRPLTSCELTSFSSEYYKKYGSSMFARKKEPGQK